MEHLYDGEVLTMGLRVNLKDAGIPFAQQMALGLTKSRIILWSRSQMSGKPKEVIGEIPLSEIVGATFEKGKLGDLIQLQFADSNSLQLESIKVNKGEDFIDELKKAIAREIV